MEEFVHLRPISPEDEPFLLQVYASTRAEELALTNWTQDQVKQFVQMQFSAQKQYYEAHYPGAQFQVILVRGEPAGRFYVHTTEREIRIMDIALLPQFRRQRIGSWLIKRIFQDADRNQKEVGIHVEIYNPAMRLYERLGFTKAADRGVYLYMVRRPEGALNPPTG